MIIARETVCRSISKVFYWLPISYFVVSFSNSQFVAFLLTIMKMHNFISKKTFKFQLEFLALEREKGWMKILLSVQILKVFNLS